MSLSKRPRVEPEEEEEERLLGAPLNLVYPFGNPSGLNVTPPFINVGSGLTIENLTLGLKIGSGLYFDGNKLSVVGSAQFKVAPPLIYDNGMLVLKVNDSFQLTEAGELSMPGYVFPLKKLGPEVKLLLSKGITTDAEGLTLKIDPVFFYNQESNQFELNVGLPLQKNNNILTLNAGNGLGLNNSQLECTLKVLPPLTRAGDVISLNYGPTLCVDEGNVNVKANAPLKFDSNGMSLNIDDTSLELSADYVGVKLAVEGGIIRTREGLALSGSAVVHHLSTNIGDSLDTDQDLLQVKLPNISGLRIDRGGLQVVCEENCGLQTGVNGVKLLTSDDFAIVNHKLSLPGSVQGVYATDVPTLNFFFNLVKLGQMGFLYLHRIVSSDPRDWSSAGILCPGSVFTEDRIGVKNTINLKGPSIDLNYNVSMVDVHVFTPEGTSTETWAAFLDTRSVPPTLSFACPSVSPCYGKILKSLVVYTPPFFTGVVPPKM